MTILSETETRPLDMDVDIDVRCDHWREKLPHVASLCRRAAVAAAGSARDGVVGEAAGEISIVLADDDFVQMLNRSWRDHDSPTNVLAFPASSEDMPSGEVRLFGDVVVAFQTTLREAEKQCKQLDHHLTHLIVHGVLHLMGYDHLTDDEAEQMETLETDILADMGIDDPYGDLSATI